MKDYEVYRVVTEYEALVDGFLDRIEDLDITREQINFAAGWCRNTAEKLLSKNLTTPGEDRQHRDRRTFNWKTLPEMLRNTGLALVLVVDDERFADTKSQLMKRRRRNQPAFAGSKRPAWLFTKKKAREMGKKRFSTMTPAQLKRHQRKAGKASAAQRRIRAVALKVSEARIKDRKGNWHEATYFGPVILAKEPAAP